MMAPESFHQPWRLDICNFTHSLTRGWPCRRPVAFSAGATDEISHSMGQRRVQLGCNVVATALPAGAESADAAQQPEDVVLYFGIIDILQAR